jgi:non-specific serine/threonine protein kinase
VLGEFPDGAWVAELAPLADPKLVPQTVATVLGLKEVPGKPITQTLAEHLKDRQALLLLDNCEHLLDACAPLAEALLRACPQVKMLASSREALGIGGEQVFSRAFARAARTGSEGHLRVGRPVRGGAALRRSAALVRPDFRLTDRNARRSPPSAAGWTAYRWPSSSPRPACGRCRPRRSTAGSTSASSC